ncbi:MAG: YihY/virulence factor BrkB family protein [Chloroflexota bacterium]|nr:YihY/virulence factor BrkB family protein [Chloroflexota bacterium]
MEAEQKEERGQPSPVAAARQVYRQSMRDDVLGLAAELAYRFFLALFPFTIFMTALGGFLAQQLQVQNPADQVVQLLGDLLPPEAAALVQAELERVIANQNAGLLSLGALLALFFATGGTKAIMKALNRAYGVEEGRAIWRRYVVAIALTLVAGGGILLAFVLFVPVRLIARHLAAAVGMGDFTGVIVDVLAALGALLLLVVAASIVYRIAPNIRLPLRAVLPGAVLFALLWLAVTFGFGFYVSNFGNYANTYGALAGVAITLIWFYVSGLILLVSAEVNEVIHEMTQPEDVERRRQESARQSEGDRESRRGAE